ncbi:MAG: hypothetical protein HKN10_15670 [Myxococcales bacterium]|nr:hypothetical protein [Myxococcales bacterium]
MLMRIARALAAATLILGVGCGSDASDADQFCGDCPEAKIDQCLMGVQTCQGAGAESAVCFRDLDDFCP